MCKISDLIVLVVEPDETELTDICDSLQNLGITTVICVHKFSEALTTIENDPTVNLVIANVQLQELQSTGTFLCSLAKKARPELLFLLSAKQSGAIFLLKSMAVSGADGVIHTDVIGEVEKVLPRWLHLAVQSRDVDDMLSNK